MRHISFSRPPWFAFALFGCGLFVSVGCDSSVKLVPVTGKVTVDGRPLSQGVVTFAPEAQAETPNQFIPIGKIDSEGNYEIRTEGRTGAPLGRYKVAVAENDQTKGKTIVKKGMTAWTAPFSQKYSTPQTTPLQVEVVESASRGHYDLKLTSK